MSGNFSHTVTSDNLGALAESSGMEYPFAAQMVRRGEHYWHHPNHCDRCGKKVGKRNLVDMRREGFWCKECAGDHLQ